MPEPKSLNETMLEAAEGFDNLASLAASYRVKLEAAGFSPAMAETVAGNWLIDLQRYGMMQQLTVPS